MILFINKYETNQYWGAENSLAKGFKKLSFPVHQFDYEVNKYQIAKRLKYILNESLKGSLLQRGTGYQIPKSVLRLLPGPKVLLLTELTARVRNQSYMWSEELFDYFYVRTPDCKMDLIENYHINPDRIEIFLSGVDTTLFYPTNSEKDIDVLFVGAITDRRSKILKQIKEAFGDRLHIRKAYSDELRELLNRSKIILNIHGTGQKDTETRVFEVLSTKSFLVSEQLSIESPFTEGEDYIATHSTSDMISCIKKYLTEDQGPCRERIAENGYQKVINEHTYFQRASQLKSQFIKLQSTRPQSADTFKSEYFKAKNHERILQISDSIITPLINFYHKVRTAR